MSESKFDKKLKKRKYRVLKDKVKLITEEEEEVAEKPEEPKPEATEAKKTETVAAKPKEAPSFNNWECANLGSSSQNEKFRRLMGIKNPAKEGTGKLHYLPHKLPLLVFKSCHRVNNSIY